VRIRSVEEDLSWLRWVLSWGTKWQTKEGHYLMRESPVRGYDIPTEKNPMRPVATQDRCEAIRCVTDQVTMEIRWNEGENSSEAIYPRSSTLRMGPEGDSVPFAHSAMKISTWLKGPVDQFAVRPAQTRRGEKPSYRFAICERYI
jgi:hypothetical protein